MSYFNSMQNFVNSVDALGDSVIPKKRGMYRVDKPLFDLAVQRYVEFCGLSNEPANEPTKDKSFCTTRCVYLLNNNGLLCRIDMKTGEVLTPDDLFTTS